MTEETTAKRPGDGHVGIWAYDPDNDRWQAVYASEDGNLQVDVISGGGTEGGATEAKQDVMIGAMLYRATTPTIYNVTMTNADTEYSQALTQWTKRFMIQCRGAYAMKLAFTSGESGTTYITIPSGGNYWEDQIRHPGLTLYFQCGEAAQVAEIVEWI